MTSSHIAALPDDGRRGPDSPEAQDVEAPLALLAAVGPAGRALTARGAATRSRLVEAAAACFSEYGYTGTRIADVVHRAGTSQGNFYRHFRSKDDVLLAVIRPVLAELLAASRRPGGVADEREALVRASTAYLTTYARHRHLLRVTREASALPETGDGGFATRWPAVRALFSGRTAAWLRSVQSQGRARDIDPDLLAEVLGSMTDQVAYVSVGLAPRTPRPERLRELGEAVGDVWWRAVYRSADERAEP